MQVRPWNSNFEIRKQLLSPHLGIDMDEFYAFQKNKAEETYDFSSIDRIANRFGYHAILPQIDFAIDETGIRKIFEETVEYIDAPIWDIIDKEAVLKYKDILDIDTITYLIEMDMWLEEYRVKIK